MITTRFYLDCRNINSTTGTAPLKLAIFKDRVRALLSLNIRLHPKQWDAKNQRPDDRNLYSMLLERKSIVDAFLFRLESSGELAGLRSCQIKDVVVAHLFDGDRVPKRNLNGFMTRFKAFAASRQAAGTRVLYDRTWIAIERFASVKGFDVSDLSFEDIDVKWLREFDNFLSCSSPSKNARNIHFRNIRAVFNEGLDDEIISCYPFRKFKIKGEPTRKRAIPVEKLRELFSMEVTERERRYLDFLKLEFLLCGINVVDLCNASDLVDGRLEYRRAKTHRLYSIKVEPEAKDIIGRYKGRERLVCFSENCRDYRFFYRNLSEVLRLVGRRIGINGLSTYYVRHSWATVAAALDIPKETIAAALGHGGNTVTDIYIDFDQRKVDDANRRVIDCVFYGKG